MQINDLRGLFVNIQSNYKNVVIVRNKKGRLGIHERDSMRTWFMSCSAASGGFCTGPHQGSTPLPLDPTGELLSQTISIMTQFQPLHHADVTVQMQKKTQKHTYHLVLEQAIFRVFCRESLLETFVRLQPLPLVSVKVCEH